MIPDSLTIRYASPADAEPLRRLAQLDSSRPLAGDVLVAQVGDEPWAALSLAEGRAVADPFRPSGDLVRLLIARASDLRRAEHKRTKRTAHFGRRLAGLAH